KEKLPNAKTLRPHLTFRGISNPRLCRLLAHTHKIRVQIWLPAPLAPHTHLIRFHVLQNFFIVASQRKDMIEAHRPHPVFLTSILIITGILSYLASFVTISVLPVIGSSLKVGVGELALVLAAQVAGLAVLQIPAGVLALRFGARWVYLAGVFLSGFSYVATALSRNVVGVQLGVFGGGSGEAIILGTSV